VTALSTWCRAVAAGPSRFVARAEALGVRELALDATLEADEEQALVVQALGAGMRVVALEAPCPRPAGTRRAPQLATEDREERLAAAAAIADTARRARELAAGVVVVALGALRVEHELDKLLSAFARRTLDEDVVARAVAQRRALSLHALDLARFGLDLVLGQSATTTIALVNRARWWEIPSPAETAALLDEFRGAPLSTWYDAAAAHARRTLGFGGGRPAVELEGACGAWLGDAAGVRTGLPWPLGDVDHEDVKKRLPEGAVRVAHCAPPVTDEEILGMIV
jgi:hypothetical protein